MTIYYIACLVVIAGQWFYIGGLKANAKIDKQNAERASALFEEEKKKRREAERKIAEMETKGKFNRVKFALMEASITEAMEKFKKEAGT